MGILLQLCFPIGFFRRGIRFIDVVSLIQIIEIVSLIGILFFGLGIFLTFRLRIVFLPCRAKFIAESFWKIGFRFQRSAGLIDHIGSDLAIEPPSGMSLFQPFAQGSVLLGRSRERHFADAFLLPKLLIRRAGDGFCRSLGLDWRLGRGRSLCSYGSLCFRSDWRCGSRRHGGRPSRLSGGEFGDFSLPVR